MISANTRKRIQAISIEGRLADRYFAVTSEQPRNIVDSRISAMPLKGRSARAGARRSLRGACRFSTAIGNGNGTVEPCGCGGWRGHGWNLGKFESNRVSDS